MDRCRSRGPCMDAHVPTPPPRAAGLLPATAIAVLAGALYVATLAPGLMWGDDAELQRFGAVGGTRVDAHVHPLWLWAARLVARLPIGALPWRVNLTSAIFGALTVGLVFALAERITRRREAATLAALAFAVSHTFWLHAVQAEVYTVYTTMLALTLLALVHARERGAAPLHALTGFLAGVTLLSHMLIVTALPGLAVGVWAGTPRAHRVRALAALALGGLAGAAVFVAVAGLNPFIHPVYGKGGSFSMLDVPRIVDLVRAAAFTLYQYPLALPFAIYGLIEMSREAAPLAWSLGLVALGDFAFTLCFGVPDQYVFYLPAYLVLALFVARGVAALPERWRRPWPALAALGLALVLLPPLAYRVAPEVAARAQRSLVSPRTLPGRDNARFFLYPPKWGERSAENFARETLRVLPESALVVADWAPYTPIQYLQVVEHARPDVALEPSRPDYPKQLDSLVALSAHRRLFLADDDPPPYYDIDGYRRHFEIRPLGPVYMLLSR